MAKGGPRMDITVGIDDQTEAGLRKIAQNAKKFAGSVATGGGGGGKSPTSTAQIAASGGRPTLGAVRDVKGVQPRDERGRFSSSGGQAPSRTLSPTGAPEHVASAHRDRQKTNDRHRENKKRTIPKNLAKNSGNKGQTFGGAYQYGAAAEGAVAQGDLKSTAELGAKLITGTKNALSARKKAAADKAEKEVGAAAGGLANLPNKGGASKRQPITIQSAAILVKAGQVKGIGGRAGAGGPMFGGGAPGRAGGGLPGHFAGGVIPYMPPGTRGEQPTSTRAAIDTAAPRPRDARGRFTRASTPPASGSQKKPGSLNAMAGIAGGLSVFGVPVGALAGAGLAAANYLGNARRNWLMSQSGTAPAVGKFGPDIANNISSAQMGRSRLALEQGLEGEFNLNTVNSGRALTRMQQFAMGQGMSAEEGGRMYGELQASGMGKYKTGADVGSAFNRMVGYSKANHDISLRSRGKFIQGALSTARESQISGGSMDAETAARTMATITGAKGLHGGLEQGQRVTQQLSGAMGGGMESSMGALVAVARQQASGGKMSVLDMFAAADEGNTEENRKALASSGFFKGESGALLMRSLTGMKTREAQAATGYIESGGVKPVAGAVTTADFGYRQGEASEIGAAGLRDEQRAMSDTAKSAMAAQESIKNAFDTMIKWADKLQGVLQKAN